MSDKIYPKLRLRDNHPTMVKLTKLYNLAEELGITLNFMHARAVVVYDKERDPNLPDLLMEDLEDGHTIENWPPTFEYKVIYDNPAYLAEEKRLNEERQKKQKEEQEKLEAARKAKEKAEQERKERELELKERTELARLQTKYKDK